MTAAQAMWAVWGMVFAAAGVVLGGLGEDFAGGVCIGVSIVGYVLLGYMIWSDRRAPGPE